MILRRGRGGPDRWLRVKVGLFFAAAALFVFGASAGDDRFVLAAIAVAAVALLLRFLPRGEDERGDGSAAG